MVGGLPKDKSGPYTVLSEAPDGLCLTCKDHSQEARAAVPDCEPDEFRRMPAQDTPLKEIAVFGDDAESVLRSVLPDERVARCVQPKVENVCCRKSELHEDRRPLRRKIVVEQQFQAVSRRFSRSAAYCRQANISSCVRYGKSCKISCSVIPDARYSRTLCTLMRIPRTAALPPSLSGSMVMISLQCMSKAYSGKCAEQSMKATDAAYNFGSTMPVWFWYLPLRSE